VTDIGSQTINTFLTSLASKQPTPGGGAVAGLLSALSSSLGSMVLEYSEGKESLKEHAALHSDCAKVLHAAQEEAMHLSTADTAAYQALHRLWKLPKDDPEKTASWNRTVEEAITVPLRTMELCLRILTTLEALVGKTNAMLLSDLLIAAILADAAVKSAILNVRINLPLVGAETDRDAFSAEANTVLDACKEISHSIDTMCGL